MLRSLAAALGITLLLGCQGDLTSPDQEGSGASSGENECDDGECVEDHGRDDRGAGGSLPTGGTASGGADGVGGTPQVTGGAASGGTGGATGGAPPGIPPEGFLAVPAQERVGLEWQPVDDAESYTIYWSTTSDVTPQSGTAISDAERNTIHHELTDGVTYYYVVTATVAGVEGPPSDVQSATPGGDFVLERFGNGDMPDLLGNGGSWVPVERRVHVLLLGDGYLANEMDNYAEDVDEYIEDILGKPIFSEIEQSFVFWSMPVVSEGRVGNGSAWALSSQPRHTDETATRIWQAIRQMPYESSGYFGSFSLEPKNIVVGMMGASNSGNSSFSGYMTSLTEPGSSPRTRVRVGFFHGRAHEFAHAFAYISDEYFETMHSSASSSETSNVFHSAVCDELPWRHLLLGGEFNPGVDQLVGAFGERENDPRLEGTGVVSDLTRVHSELKCHINGSHENSMLYGGSDNLRVGRFCNWCRELIGFAAFERTGVLDAETSWETWKSNYRGGFYDVVGFVTPDTVPQENSLGQPHFDACDGP